MDGFFIHLTGVCGLVIMENAEDFNNFKILNIKNFC